MGKFELRSDDLKGTWGIHFVIGPLYIREGNTLPIAIAIGKPDDIPIEPVRTPYSGENSVEMEAETFRLALIRGEVLHVYRGTTFQEFRQRFEAVRHNLKANTD